VIVCELDKNTTRFLTLFIPRPGMGPDGGNDTRFYGKDCTILLNVGDNQRVKAYEVISDLENKFGKGVVYACVPKSGDCFELTLPNKNIADELSTGVIIGEKSYDCSLLYSEIVVVSFMHLPAYITDEEIKIKLASYGIALKSKIKRRYHRGTRCADGTRYVQVKFPPHIKSLNYLMKFETVHGPQLFRVKHNNQTKVCTLCLSDEHLRKDCPDFKCFRCGQQGHVKRDCTAERCQECIRYPAQCVCETLEPRHDDDDEEIEDIVENQDDRLESDAEENVHDDDDNVVEDETEVNDDESDENYDLDTVHSDEMDTSNDEVSKCDEVNNFTDCENDDKDEKMKPTITPESQIKKGVDDDTTECEVAEKMDNSALLVEFTSTPIESPTPSSKCEQVAESEQFTHETNTAVIEDNDMDTYDLDDGLINSQSRRQKRKSVDKSLEVAKRAKEVKKKDNKKSDVE